MSSTISPAIKLLKNCFQKYQEDNLDTSDQSDCHVLTGDSEFFLLRKINPAYPEKGTNLKMPLGLKFVCSF
mgnify:CR=1 FL=1